MMDDLAARNHLMQVLPAGLAQAFPEVRSRAKLLPSGPPVPYPVQFRVVGPDAQQLRVLADRVKAVMQQHPNLRGVNDNWNESVKAMRLEIDQDKARALGVSSQSIAQAMQTMFSGTTIGQYREGDKLINIVLRQPVEERDALSDLAAAYVPTSSGKSIPLLQIAQPVFAWEPGVLWRDARSYAITVQGDVREGLQGATLTQALKPQLDRLQVQWTAEGWGEYRIVVAGVHLADAAIAQLQPCLAGVHDRPAGDCGRGGRLAAAQPAVWLRGPAGGDRPDGDDFAFLCLFRHGRDSVECLVGYHRHCSHRQRIQGKTACIKEHLNWARVQ